MTVSGFFPRAFPAELSDLAVQVLTTESVLKYWSTPSPDHYFLPTGCRFPSRTWGIVSSGFLNLSSSAYTDLTKAEDRVQPALCGNLRIGKNVWDESE